MFVKGGECCNSTTEELYVKHSAGICLTYQLGILEAQKQQNHKNKGHKALFNLIPLHN